MHLSLMFDARARSGPGSRTRKRTPSKSTIGRIRKAQKKLAELGEVDVLTAEDNDVCPVCEAISEDGPYDLDTAQDLIPAHPFCRCAFVPAGTLQDAFDPDQPRDPHGRWTKWFGESKVVTESGSPRVVYHGTIAPEFEQFAVGEPPEQREDDPLYRSGSGNDPRTFLGSHFSEETGVANKFAKGLYGERAGSSEGGRVVPVYLRIEHPFKTTDSEMLNDMLKENYSHHEIDRELEERASFENDNIEKLGKKYDSDPEYRAEINQAALTAGTQAYDEPDLSLGQEMAAKYRAKLQEQGYDGIKYKNEIEGGVSWIAFEPDQIKSALGSGFTRGKPGIKDFDPNEPRDPHGRWTGGGDEGTQKIVNSEDVLEVGPMDIVGGFITPDGTLLEISSGDSHDTVAKKVGTSLDEVMSEGTGRIYASEPFLGIHTNRRPTDAQIMALIKIARERQFDTFGIEGKDQHDYKNILVTPGVIREQINSAWGYRDSILTWMDFDPADWDESKHPRDPRGRFASSEGASYYEPEASARASSKTWNDLTSKQQERVEREWRDQTYNQEKEYQEEQWHSGGEAREDARSRVAYKFNQEGVTTIIGATRPDRIGKQEVLSWVNEAIDKAREDHDGEIPYTNAQLARAITIDYERGSSVPEISFHDDHLQEPSDLSYGKGQLSLPGIEHADPSGHLTEEMRKTIGEHMRQGFEDEAETVENDLEPPDFSETINETLDEVWSGMDDKEKERWGKRNTSIFEEGEKFEPIQPRNPLDREQLAHFTDVVKNAADPRIYPDIKIDNQTTFISDPRLGPVAPFGSTNPRTGKIVMYARNFDGKDDKFIAGTTVHESMHKKWDEVLKSMGQSAGQENVFSLKEFETKEARFKMIDEISDHPVSPYADMYWAMASRGRGDIATAVHETLAEIARHEHEEGELPDGVPTWNAFYKKINKVWEKLHA